MLLMAKYRLFAGSQKLKKKKTDIYTNLLRCQNKNARNFRAKYPLVHRVGRVLSVSPVVGIGTPPPL